MKLEDQVVSLELAKQMKELGFEQESVWYWGTMGDLTQSRMGSSMYNKEGFGTSDLVPYTSAYTVAELGEMLPDKCSYYPGRDLPWCCHYQEGNPENHLQPFVVHREYGLTEADSRASMLIYLKKKGLL